MGIDMGNTFTSFLGHSTCMSWKELSSVVRRLAFVKLALKAQQSMSQLCRLFGLSRKSGYKWKPGSSGKAVTVCEIGPVDRMVRRDELRRSG